MANPLVIQVVGLFVIGLSLGITGTGIWTLTTSGTQQNEIHTAQDQADTLSDNVTYLSARLDVLEVSCTDATLNDTVAMLEQQLSELEAAAEKTIQEIPMLLETVGGDRLSKGMMVSDAVFPTATAPNNYITFEELDSANFTQYNVMGAPSDTFVRITTSGEYVLGIYWQATPTVGCCSAVPNKALFVELVDDSGMQLESIQIDRRYTPNTDHLSYISDAPFNIRVRATSAQSPLTVFGPPTFFFVIKIQ